MSITRNLQHEKLIPNLFETLAVRSAGDFLRCDSTYWSDGYRALLVEHYLSLVRLHEAEQLDWQLRHRFAQLTHPYQAAQLGPIIVNRTEDPLVRESAIDMAG